MITIKLCLFASLSEALDTREALIQLPPGSTLSSLKSNLIHRDTKWQALNDDRILCAVNHEIIGQPEFMLNNHDEVAFFPPVTGG
ncbi:MoaD/ThiS family protein [Marinagarivorans algicola]|uniref:MoaD/ThiS family protein n=1 Tax=Marinagarivorans algicola TaxID=1513270 RepID=UPI0006B52AFD|nr:MoaD/ThiS family protein [Marinagarivorans algicola]